MITERSDGIRRKGAQAHSNRLSDEAAGDIANIYWQELGRGMDADGLVNYEDQLAAGRSLGDVRWAVAHSDEAQANLQALFSAHLGRTATADEAAGFATALSLGTSAGTRFTVSSGVGTIASAYAPTLLAELGSYVTLSGGLVPTLTAPDGQVITFRNATELAGFAMGLAVEAGQAGRAAWDTYGLTTAWLDEVGQGYIQAAWSLQQAAQASAASGNAAGAYLQSIGAQMAMQIQAMPPSERHGLVRQVPLGALAAEVVVTGDVVDDASGQAGFSFRLYDADPARTALIAQAQNYADRAAEAQAAGNQLLAFLDQCQARVDMAYAQLSLDQRDDKMLSVAQRFVDAAFAASGRGDWNLVQTLEVAADVSLRIAAMPVDQRHRLTERFMHENVKHDITVNPDDADPFATFSDHSKGEDVIGAIVEAVVGVVVNILAVIPVTAPVFAPIAVAWDTAQAAKSFSEGNILGGVLNLASAVGVGLLGGAQGGFAGYSPTQVASGLGFSSVAALKATGSAVLEGAALVGGAAGIAQSAANGDGLGIAAGMLEIAAAVAGGLVTTGALGQDAALVNLANNVAIGAGLGSAGLSASDAFLHGDLAGGLSASLSALLGQVAKKVAEDSRVDPMSGKPLPADDLVDPWAEGGEPKNWWEVDAPATTGGGTSATGAVQLVDYATLPRSGPDMGSLRQSLAAQRGELQGYLGEIERAPQSLANVEAADRVRNALEILDIDQLTAHGPAATRSGQAEAGDFKAWARTTYGTDLSAVSAEQASAFIWDHGNEYVLARLDEGQAGLTAPLPGTSPEAVAARFGLAYAGGIAQGAVDLASGAWDAAKGVATLVRDAAAVQGAMEASAHLDDASAREVLEAAQQRFDQDLDQLSQAANAAYAVASDLPGAAKALYDQFKAAQAQAEADGTLPEFYGKLTGRAAFEGALIGEAAIAAAARARSLFRPLTGFEQIEQLTPLAPATKGNISSGKVFARNGSIGVELTTPEEQALAGEIVAGNNRKENTERLTSLVARRQGLVELEGGKYGTDNGFDHVFRHPDGTITILVDSKQMTLAGSVQLMFPAAGGQMQMSDAWVRAALANLDENTAAYQAVRDAMRNGTLVKGVSALDRTTGLLTLFRVQ